MRRGARIGLAARNSTLAATAEIVRCSVWTLHADAVIYRGALRFEEVCTAFWEEQAALLPSA